MRSHVLQREIGSTPIISTDNKQTQSEISVMVPPSTLHLRSSSQQGTCEKRKVFFVHLVRQPLKVLQQTPLLVRKIQGARVKDVVDDTHHLASLTSMFTEKSC